MKALIFIFIGLIVNSSFACDKPRSLTQVEKTKFTNMACDSFNRIYGPWMSVDKSLCLQETRLKICENTPEYGTYLYGKLVYGVYRSRDCNFILNKGKIIAADCGDE